MGSWVSGLSLLSVITGIVLPGIVFSESEVSNGHTNLLPHQALYSLSLKSSDAPGKLVDVSGFVRAALERTCDGWITSEEVKMQLSLQSDKQWNQDLMYTSWESLDGRKYRFASRSSNNGKVIKHRGAAHSKADLPGVAIYSEPKNLTIKLPPGTHFYFGLTSWLIEKARSGARRAETTVFDGTDPEGPQKAIAFIIPFKSQANKLGDKFNTILGPLANMSGWKMHIAFFPLDGREAEPDYEVRAVILDNGVMPKLDLVFKSFTAIQTLKKIEGLKAPKC